jgi:hypothetical protein
MDLCLPTCLLSDGYRPVWRSRLVTEVAALVPWKRSSASQTRDKTFSARYKNGTRFGKTVAFRRFLPSVALFLLILF